MNRRIRIIAAALLAGAAIILICLVIPEPVYKGRSVSSWVDGLGEPFALNDLWKASDNGKDPMVLSILTEALDKKDTSLQKTWRRVWLMLPFWTRSYLPRPISAEDIRARAALGLFSAGLSGTYYKPAIPKLIRLAETEEKANVRHFAIEALGGCLAAKHPPDENETAAAIHALKNAMKDPQVNPIAAWALEQIDPGNAAAKEALGR